MTPLNALGGLAAIGTIAAMMVVPGIGSDGGGANTTVVDAPITIRAEQETIVAQFGAPPAEVPPQQQAGSASASTNNQTVLRRRYHAATPTGPLAESLAEMLDEEVELQIAGDLNSLVDQLESQLEKPVILSQRVIDYAQLEPSTPLQYTSRSEPLRTALRKLLQPLGLKATIESEGLVITADHAALVHRGIGTDQWLSVNDKMMREAEQKLAKMISKLFVETPLSEAVSDLSLELDLAIVIDTRSLEEIGLDADAGVACDVKSLSGYDLISWLLRDLELTLSVNGNLFTVMTLESAEDNLLNRVYWLEGIGLGGDFDSLLSLIETTILPDTWEALGGSSTMSPALGNRPGLVVSTTYNVHRQIEQLINALRENSFELDALSEEVEVTLPVPPPVQSGGAFSGGGQGGGGQGGGFM